MRVIVYDVRDRDLLHKVATGLHSLGRAVTYCGVAVVAAGLLSDLVSDLAFAVAKQDVAGL